MRKLEPKICGAKYNERKKWWDENGLIIQHIYGSMPMSPRNNESFIAEKPNFCPALF
jgi:hypothetical protein